MGKDGIKRYTTEIVVDMQGTMQLLGGRFLAVQLPQHNEDSGCQLCIGAGVQLHFPQVPSPHWLAALCLALTTQAR